MQDLPGGPNFFLSLGELRAAKLRARGVLGHAPLNFFKGAIRCVLKYILIKFGLKYVPKISRLVAR